MPQVELMTYDNDILIPPPAQALEAPSEPLHVAVTTQYLNEQSHPEEHCFVFGYTFCLHNHSPDALIVMHRHWLITDANGNLREIEGHGILGRFPKLESGSTFEYTSGVVLETPVGTMEGEYVLHNPNGLAIQIHVAPFRLAKPDVLQ